MTNVSIVGAGNMAKAIGTRAARHGHTVELISRDPAKAQALADQIGPAATVSPYGTRPAGDIVVLAVLHAGAVDVVTQFGKALAGKILLDITNPFTDDAGGLVTRPGDSMSERILAAAPKDAQVVKAFNTIFGGAIADDKTVDAFFAGDSAEAKTQVAAFLDSLGLRPRDAGGLSMAHALEWGGLLLVGVARSGAGFDLALRTEVV